MLWASHLKVGYEGFRNQGQDKDPRPGKMSDRDSGWDEKEGDSPVV